MRYELINTGSCPIAKIYLNLNEDILLESGAMLYHNAKLELTGHLNSGGAPGFGLGRGLKALARSTVTGERMFITKATALDNQALITLAPKGIGQIKELKIRNNIHWYLNDGAFLASDTSIKIDIIRQKLSKAIFAGTGGLFIMKTNGIGDVLISSNGDLIEVELNGQEKLVVDNYHVVAWEESLSYNIKIASGLFGFTTGEGIVNEFSGKGKIIIQTRNIQAIAQQLIPFIPTRTS